MNDANINLSVFGKRLRAKPAGYFSLSAKGVTLAEVLLSAVILAFSLTGILLLFINSIILNENNRNFILAYSAMQAKMEEIKNANFDSLDTFNGTDFYLDGFSSGNARGKIEVNNESADLKRIKIAACFMSRNRLIGDSIINCQSSPAEFVTLIAR